MPENKNRQGQATGRRPPNLRRARGRLEMPGKKIERATFRSQLANALLQYERVCQNGCTLQML